MNMPYTFAVGEFGFSDPNDSPPNSLAAVKITKLPTAGVLTNNGLPVSAGQFISAVDIAAGLFKFTPVGSTRWVIYASFTFQVQDNGGTAGGGSDLDLSPNKISVHLMRPEDQNLIRGLYLDVLGRSPDPIGLEYWTFSLDHGRPTSAVVASFWESPEHRGIQVDQFFQSIYHRAPDPGERQTWINNMIGGMSEESTMVALLNSDEYRRYNPLTTSFVIGIFRDVLGDNTKYADQLAWVVALNNNSATPSQLVQALVDSHDRHLNLVDSYFRTFLGRDPNPTEETTWTDQLDQHLSSDQALAKLVLSSPEYCLKSH